MSRSALSRRNFIRSAGIGVAGATLGFRGAGQALAAAKESGIITLDAVLITYFSATIGATGGSIWRLNNRYADTYRLKSAENPELKLRGRVPGGEEILFIGHMAKQTESATVSNGLTLRYRGFGGVSYGYGTGGGIATAAHTRFYGMLKPRLHIRGNSRKLQVRFIERKPSSRLMLTI